jgi:membrane protein DedA with SNARE-associated domain
MQILVLTVIPWVVGVISSLGYFGTFFCMTIEGACIPLPSEIILTFSGFLVSTGRFNFALAALAGAMGNLFGSTIMYFVGLKGGHPFFEKYGKYFLISHADMQNAEKWFAKYGDKTVFFSQLLPVLRTYISLPSGILEIKYRLFALYTFLGALLWSTFLVFIGMKFGEHWMEIEAYFQKFNLLISLAVVGVVGFFIYHQVKKIRDIQKGF